VELGVQISIEPTYLCFNNPSASQEFKKYIIENLGLINKGDMTRIIERAEEKDNEGRGGLFCWEYDNRWLWIVIVGMGS